MSDPVMTPGASIEETDIAILGGGCAGLALARELARSAEGPRVIVIEPRDAYGNDRTWCFWAPDTHPMVSPATHTWTSWRLSGGGREIVHDTEKLPYRMVQASTYYSDALSIIQASPRVDLRRGTRVTRSTVSAEGVLIETDKGAFHARYAIDTRPPPQERLAQSPLLQVFSGADVSFDRAVLSPGEAGLMRDLEGDREAPEAGVRFTYILPYSDREGLVETTRFVPSWIEPSTLDEALEADLARISGSTGYKIQRRERAVLPMGLPPESPPDSGRLIRAGTAGGALRASTGYGFLAIQHWASLCARRLYAGRPPLPPQPPPGPRAFLDATFLRAVRARPDRAPGYLLATAGALRPVAFARFMSDRATPGDWLRVMAALPKFPLAAAAAAELLGLPQPRPKGGGA